MGDYRVIAGVSRTLRTLLEDRMQSSPPAVTLLPPDASPQNGGQDRVNVHLFRVHENAELRNQPVPGGGPTAQSGGPPLSLNLHYLLTVFKNQNPEGAQQMMGDAMRVLHDYSIITEALPRQRVPASSNGEPPPVLDTRLHDEHEYLEISLEPLTASEMAEIWSAFTVPYRLSVAYSVSVVQIESRRPRSTVRLVGEPPDAGPQVHPVPFRRPEILEVRVVRRDDPAGTERRYPHARIGDTLVVQGRHLSGGEKTHVMLGSVDVTGSATVQDSRVEVTIPDDPQLQPGPQSVHLRQDLIERPSTGEPFSYTSNRSFFALVPWIERLTPDPLTPPDTLSIEGKRLYQDQEGVENVTFIGHKRIGEASYTITTETKIEMNISSLDPGDYPVRVRVGQVESIDDKRLTIA